MIYAMITGIFIIVLLIVMASYSSKIKDLKDTRIIDLATISMLVDDLSDEKQKNVEVVKANARYESIFTEEQIKKVMDDALDNSKNKE